MRLVKFQDMAGGNVYINPEYVCAVYQSFPIDDRPCVEIRWVKGGATVSNSMQYVLNKLVNGIVE